jgi:hypothetical protein
MHIQACVSVCACACVCGLRGTCDVERNTRRSTRAPSAHALRRMPAGAPAVPAPRLRRASRVRAPLHPQATVVRRFCSRLARRAREERAQDEVHHNEAQRAHGAAREAALCAQHAARRCSQQQRAGVEPYFFSILRCGLGGGRWLWLGSCFSHQKGWEGHPAVTCITPCTTVMFYGARERCLSVRQCRFVPLGLLRWALQSSQVGLLVHGERRRTRERQTARWTYWTYR